MQFVCAVLSAAVKLNEQMEYESVPAYDTLAMARVLVRCEVLLRLLPPPAAGRQEAPRFKPAEPERAGGD